jgi:DNA-binding CsgD family transcriptional regulator
MSGEQAAPSRHYALTPGERSVLALVAQGYTDETIAECLVLTLDAVAQRIHRFSERTSLRGRRLVVWCKDHLACCIAKT